MSIDPVWMVNSTAPWNVPFEIDANGTTSVLSNANKLVELSHEAPGSRLNGPA